MIDGLTYHPRSTWENPALPVNHPGVYRPPALDLARIDTIVYHYTGSDDLIDGDPGEHASDLPGYLRAIQADYRRRLGFSIGYSWAIDWLGGVWELRGFDYRAAATGGRKSTRDGSINPETNRRTLAFLCLVDGSDPLTPQAARSARLLTAEAERRTGRRLDITAHSDHDYTACCGDGIRHQIATGYLDPERAAMELFNLRAQPSPLYARQGHLVTHVSPAQWAALGHPPADRIMPKSEARRYTFVGTLTDDGNPWGTHVDG